MYLVVDLCNSTYVGFKKLCSSWLCWLVRAGLSWWLTCVWLFRSESIWFADVTRTVKVGRLLNPFGRLLL